MLSIVFWSIFYLPIWVGCLKMMNEPEWVQDYDPSEWEK